MKKCSSISTLTSVRDSIITLLPLLSSTAAALIGVYIAIIHYELVVSPKSQLFSYQTRQSILAALEDCVFLILCIYLAMRLFSFAIKRFIRKQSKQPTCNETEQFSRFVANLKLYVEQVGLDYEGSADDPLYDQLCINLTFSMEEEVRASVLIRRVRDELCQSTAPLHSKQKRYPIAVNKQWIASVSCWAVTFYFASDWKFNETLDFTFSSDYPDKSTDTIAEPQTTLDK